MPTKGLRILFVHQCQLLPNALCDSLSRIIVSELSYAGLSLALVVEEGRAPAACRGAAIALIVNSFIVRHDGNRKTGTSEAKRDRRIWLNKSAGFGLFGVELSCQASHALSPCGGGDRM